MEKFTTKISENYLLEEKVKSLVETFVLDNKNIRTFEFNGSEFNIAFTSKTSNFDYILPMVNQIKEISGFPITKLSINESDLQIILKK